MKKENNKAAARNQKLLQECNTTYARNGHRVRPLFRMKLLTFGQVIMSKRVGPTGSGKKISDLDPTRSKLQDPNERGILKTKPIYWEIKPFNKKRGN